MTTTATPLPPVTSGPLIRVQDVVPADLWDKQVKLLVRDYPYDTVMAGRVLGQGYAYLLTAMNHRGEGLGLVPSRLVDIGVHTIILDTVAYADLCNRYNGGHFLHHVPKIETKSDGSVMTTANLIATDGWDVDLTLWADAAECGPCHPGNDSH